MAGKKGASRTKPTQGIGGRQGHLYGSFVSFAGSNGIRTGPPRPELPFVESKHVSCSSSLSLREEARNTERRSLWSSNSHLRHTQVHFVRAEDLNRNTPIEQRGDDGQDEDPTKRAHSYPSAYPDTTYTPIQMRPEESDIQDHSRNEGSDVGALLDGLSKSLESTSPAVLREQEFLIDAVGSGAAIDTGIVPPVVRSSSPWDSSSCDEVVIFTGRSRTKGKGDSQNKPLEGSATDPDTLGNVRVDVHPIEDRATKLDLLTSNTGRVTTRSVHSLEENINFGQPGTAHRRLAHTDSNGDRKKWGKKPTSVIGQKNATEDASLADYIANISDAAQGEEKSAITSIHGQGISATRSGKGHCETDSSVAKARAKDVSSLSSGLNISNIENPKDLCTSSDDSDEKQNVISRRDRPSELQHLVVSEGTTANDARWIRHTSLESQNAFEQIRIYDAEKQQQSHRSADDSDTSSLSVSERGEASATDEEREGLRDEEDLLRRRIDRLTDEKVARLLAKQEELGMGSNKVVLFDDDFADDVNDSDDVGTEHVFSTRKRSNLVHRQQNRGKRSEGAFDPAVALANLLDQDIYSGFDVMDHDRPSVKTRSLKRRGAQPSDISDTDLQLSLSSAWHKDRLKKRAKKQEREELRAQGLLGKKNKKKADMQAKYMEGMTIYQIKDEIREFVFSTNESLPLPPMDKRHRKMVHEIANAFNLKSKSVGAGRTRFPVLYKTSRSGNLSTESLKVIESRLGRTAFMPRMNNRAKRSPVVLRRGAGGSAGPAAAAFSYRDGEVVGATAPELGAENKGRAMLEKMGWSTGTALGACNNKGILQPVPHVVKTSRAGLR